MARITYIDHAGTERIVDVEAGHSVKDGAINNGIPGIDADCGGLCACATCHVFVDEQWIDRTGTRSEDETSMLQLHDDVKENSRLSCQIMVSDILDGLIVHTPEIQF